MGSPMVFASCQAAGRGHAVGLVAATLQTRVHSSWHHRSEADSCPVALALAVVGQTTALPGSGVANHTLSAASQLRSPFFSHATWRRCEREIRP